MPSTVASTTTAWPLNVLFPLPPLPPPPGLLHPGTAASTSEVTAIAAQYNVRFIRFFSFGWIGWSSVRSHTGTISRHRQEATSRNLILLSEIFRQACLVL